MSLLKYTLLCASAALLPLSAAAQAHDGETLSVTGSDGAVLEGHVLSEFDAAWAMTFLPDGRALVTEKTGELWLLDDEGQKLGKISGVPDVTAQGQGGLGDIILHPDFETNGQVYVSYVERDAKDNALSGAAVTRATLTLSSTGGRMASGDVIWRQSPKVTGNGHYGHRMAVSGDGHLFITSGERQKFNPAQNMDMNLGKVVRLNLDGSIPDDNPFSGQGGVTEEIWTFGHRNPLGIDFDAEGKLWVHEMGPKGGDEVNHIVRSSNYGYPIVSDGDHYSGVKMTNHKDMPIYKAPAISWVPAISPAGFVIYKGDMFADWAGDGFIGGLSSEAVIRVEFKETETRRGPKTVVTEAARYDWGKRIREIEQGPDGALYVLEDGEGGRLIRFEPDEE